MRLSNLLCPALVIALAGCAAAPPEGGVGTVVPPGKADDFISLSAAEFVVAGRAEVTIEEEYVTADEETRLARVRELVGYQQVAIAWFLNQYLIDK